MSSDGELDEGANELTPFYKPGYVQAWSWIIKLVVEGNVIMISYYI